MRKIWKNKKKMRAKKNRKIRKIRTECSSIVTALICSDMRHAYGCRTLWRDRIIRLTKKRSASWEKVTYLALFGVEQC